MSKILIIDGQNSILESLQMFLSQKGHLVSKATTGSEGFMLFNTFKPNVTIMDICLPDKSGKSLFGKICNNSSKIIIISAIRDSDTTIETMKKGAFDYIHKPLDFNQLDSSINRALNLLKAELEVPLFEMEERPSDRPTLVGNSDKIRLISKSIGTLCKSRVPVLIEGETGTGKELITRVIHRNSPLSNGPFITLDCSCAVETLIESDIFGHEKGAFTGAIQQKIGKIEMANNGTLFIDEIAELPLSLQPKFLGFIDRREYLSVGGQQIKKCNSRIIAATNRNLMTLVKQGKFKEDLFYRLMVFTIRVPPLRERIFDILDLIKHFAQQINLEYGTAVTRLEKGALDILMSHSWPGNVRELKNLLTYASVKSKGSVILCENIEKFLSKSYFSLGDSHGYNSLSDIEKLHIHKILSKTKGNRTNASKMLGISLPTLRSKIRKYNLEKNI